MTHDNFGELSLETDAQASERIDGVETQGEGEVAPTDVEDAETFVDPAFEAATIASVAAETLSAHDPVAEAEIAQIKTELEFSDLPSTEKAADIERLSGGESAPVRDKEGIIEPVHEGGAREEAGRASVNEKGVVDALGYVSTTDSSYKGRLSAWTSKVLANDESRAKYKWGAAIGGGSTLAAGLGASALGYAGLGVGLAFGAPFVLAGGGALWGGKKLYDKWRERKSRKALDLDPADTLGY